MVRIVAMIFVCSMIVVGLSLLNGCSSPKTESETTRVMDIGSQPPIRKAQSQGSLEDLRRGAAPATPKDSPLKEIYFDFDVYDLRADARATLRANAEWLKQNSAVRVDIEGHCDDRGTTEYNLALGAKRAQAAADYLIALGVAAQRLSIESLGEEAPVCHASTSECRQKNRRDRFVPRAAKPGV